MSWSVYVVRCSDDSLYTGITTDLGRRLREHQSGGPKSAKYVRGRSPLALVYTRVFATRSEAMTEEYRIKQLSKADKESLIRKSAE